MFIVQATEDELITSCHGFCHRRIKWCVQCSSGTVSSATWSHRHLPPRDPVTSWLLRDGRVSIHGNDRLYVPTTTKKCSQRLIVKINGTLAQWHLRPCQLWTCSLAAGTALHNKSRMSVHGDVTRAMEELVANMFSTLLCNYILANRKNRDGLDIGVNYLPPPPPPTARPRFYSKQMKPPPPSACTNVHRN